MLQEVHSCLTATAKLTQLTSLSFDNLQLSEESDSDLDEGLLEALVSLTLQQLHIDPCVLNSVTCTSLAAAFSHTNVTALRSVVIVASKAEMQRDECTALLQELGKLPGLQCLKLTRVKQDCDDLMAICKDMKRLTGLTQLHLEHCLKVRRGRMHVTDILAGEPYLVPNDFHFLPGNSPCIIFRACSPVLPRSLQLTTTRTAFTAPAPHIRAKPLESSL